MFKLKDGVLQLLIQYQSIGYDDNRMENFLVFSVMQAG